MQVGGGERGGVDADAAEHLDVLSERLRVLRRYHVAEPGLGEPRRAAYELRPVAEHGEARPGQARVPLVGVVHADQRARAPRGAVGERALLEQDHALHPARGERVGEAAPVDAAADDDDVGGLHAHFATTAVASISTRMSSRTNLEISTRVLAGRCAPKYSLRATFTFSRSAMFLRKTVTLQTSAKVAPAAVRQALMFSRALRAWAVTSSPPTVRPCSSEATQPETKTILPARTTWVKWLIGSDMPGTGFPRRCGRLARFGGADRFTARPRFARLAMVALLGVHNRERSNTSTLRRAGRRVKREKGHAWGAPPRRGGLLYSLGYSTQGGVMKGIDAIAELLKCEG